MEIVTDRRLALPADAKRVWAAVVDVDAYPAWWPWLKSFEAEPLAPGAVWKCEVESPLRYRVTFSLKFDVVVPEQHIEASVRGDISGGAWLDFEDRDDQSEVWIRSSLAPRSPFLRMLTATLRPVAKFGHDWIISNGADQFARRALPIADAEDTTT